jgi:hypothetical protein
MLSIGDKVEILDSAKKQNQGKHGKIVLPTDGLKRNTQPIGENGKLPKLEKEPRYTVELDDGTVLHYVREQQLRKL